LSWKEKTVKKMRIMNSKPLNAETPIEHLRSWITPNSVFFDRNQGAIPPRRIPIKRWSLSIAGEVQSPLTLSFDDILSMPKVITANTLECSGNSRSLLPKKASGNPWTVGGVGNAVWGGIWLRELLTRACLKPEARHVAFEGFDKSLGSSGIKFIRSIPIDKAVTSTLLAYEMNGEPLPLKHGYPLRALALGWTGANCVKWLTHITVLDHAFEGHFMDNVYRVFQEGQEPATGAVVTNMKLKSIITQPTHGETLKAGTVLILGAAYGGEKEVEKIEISLDGGGSWQVAEFIGPRESYAWRQWQMLWEVSTPGEYTIMARATDAEGNKQPMNAQWNVLGYGNNGVAEHAVRINIT
jgi:DMSO/TMAO reductase YedYZ molybdopterin-dependent catalytic subunit